ncbi:MAG: 50S ribosomal protein L29 [Bacteroidales bacterium]|nr:50S ribosomal protein L29 [Bacteroidales bacterium]
MEQEVIIELGTAELIERLDEDKKQLVKLRLNHAVSPLENPNKITFYKKAIARMETELRSRQLEEDNNNQ